MAFCREQGIELTRSRPYRKNDQAWVEQKNGAVVRRMVGYGRLEGVPAAEALARLYSEARLFVNVFQTSWPRIVQWLETEPHRTAKELFDRLCREQPGVFLPGQLQTLQRRVRDWRRLAARRLLFADPTTSPQDAVGSPIAVDARNEIAADVARLDQDAGATPPAGCPGGDHLERPGSRAPDPSPETEGTGTIFLRQAGSILK